MKVTCSELKYNGRIIKVYFDTIEQDDKQIFREVIRHNGGAGVLVERDGKFAFVKQYRHPFGRDFLEVPAGMKNPNECASFTALRELEEECGLVANEIQFICEFAVSPGYTDEKIFLYYANNFNKGKQNFDEDESLTVIWIQKEQTFEMLKNGEIKDAKTVIALQWYKLNKM